MWHWRSSRLATRRPPMGQQRLAAERLVLVKAKGLQPRAQRSNKSKDSISTHAGCSTRRGAVRQSLEARLRELGSPFESPPRSTISTCKCLVASGIGLAIPARFLARIRSAGGWSESRGPASVEASIVFMQAGHLGRLEPTATSPTRVSRPFRRARGSLIATNSTGWQRRIIACDTLRSEVQLHEYRAGAILVDRVAWLILRHAVFGIWSYFSETNRLVERVSSGQELQTFQSHNVVADRSRV